MSNSIEKLNKKLKEKESNIKTRNIEIGDILISTDLKNLEIIVDIYTDIKSNSLTEFKKYEIKSLFNGALIKSIYSDLNDYNYYTSITNPYMIYIKNKDSKYFFENIFKDVFNESLSTSMISKDNKILKNNIYAFYSDKNLNENLEKFRNLALFFKNNIDELNELEKLRIKIIKEQEKMLLKEMKIKIKYFYNKDLNTYFILKIKPQISNFNKKNISIYEKHTIVNYLKLDLNKILDLDSSKYWYFNFEDIKEEEFKVHVKDSKQVTEEHFYNNYYLSSYKFFTDSLI